MFDVHFNINNNFKFNPLKWFKKTKYTKDSVNILFIDDNDMPVVDSLKKSGYKVKRVRDVKNIDDAEIKNSQIIFIDFDGVGRSISPKHQGAGLVKELKLCYGKKKFIILYTAQSVLPSNTVMESFVQFADSRMLKDSDVTDFNEKIKEALEIL